ncbi:hypothetical protein IMY05_010G0090300 [Salix suchowensis]|nr:hypothetical protein IMY05_010G0090300 [Salix suchowensis]
MPWKHNYLLQLTGDAHFFFFKKLALFLSLHIPFTFKISDSLSVVKLMLISVSGLFSTLWFLRNRRKV